MMNRRDEFLVEMYRQMFNDINRHIMVVWQSVGVVIGALAAFALVEKNIITVDWAAVFIVLLCGWLLANLTDSNYWYHRNLVIIANIERQFLEKSDLKDIHYYFGKHRPGKKMITHLLIQQYLGFGLAALVLLLHFLLRVRPGIGVPWRNLDPVRALPYLIAAAVAICIVCLRKRCARAYKEFLENSPGILVDTSGITYGPGHGFKAPRSNRRRD
jgi:MFS family permease